MAETFYNGHVCYECAFLTTNDDLSHLDADDEKRHRALVDMFDWKTFDTVAIGADCGMFDHKCDLCGKWELSEFYSATFFYRKAAQK